MFSDFSFILRRVINSVCSYSKTSWSLSDGPEARYPMLAAQGSRSSETVKFKEPKYVGDPINAIRIFNEKEVDELILLDIDASRLNQEPNYELIAEVAGECFMPICYGGGIKTLEHAEKIFS